MSDAVKGFRCASFQVEGYPMVGMSLSFEASELIGPVSLDMAAHGAALSLSPGKVCASWL